MLIAEYINHKTAAIVFALTHVKFACIKYWRDEI